MTEHWKYRATRCAVIGCERARVKGWSTCALSTHKPLGQSLYGAGRIEPIQVPERCICHPKAVLPCIYCAGVGRTTPTNKELADAWYNAIVAQRKAYGGSE